MHEEAGEHGDAVPAQLLPQRTRVLHVQDLPRHQEDDPKRKVPVRRRDSGGRRKVLKGVKKLLHFIYKGLEYFIFCYR